MRESVESKQGTLEQVALAATLIGIAIAEVLLTIVWIAVEKFYYHLGWLAALKSPFCSWVYWILFCALAVVVTFCAYLEYCDRNPTMVD